MPTIKDIAPESVFTIELNTGTPGRQGPKGEQGVQGIQGPKGETGPKPIRGIDYFTQQDISNMVTTITGNSNSAFNENVSAKTKEFNANVSAKTSAFDNNAVLKTEEFNTNANTEKTEFNLNANNKTTEFNANASNKKNEIDTHVENKTTEFDNHVVEKINEFKEETSDYVTETELENKGYLVESDLNGYAKEEDLFSGSYNDLEDKPKIPSKVSELTNDKDFINEIPSEYVTEEEQTEFIKPYNERITENEKDISELEATIDILTNTDTKKGELVHITDALPLATFENKVDGNVEQETTKGTNEIDTLDNVSIANLTITKNTNGTLLVNGTLSELVPRNIAKGRKLKADTYTISVDRNGKEMQAEIYYRDSTETQKYLFKSSSKLTTTFDEDVTIVSIVAYFPSGTYTNDIVSLQIEKGETITEYEKFTNGASPNPSYEQPISVIEGSVGVKVNGKNLYNKDTDTIGKVYSDKGVLGETPLWTTSDWIKINPSKGYYLSCKTTNSSNVLISEFDKDKNFIQRIARFNAQYIPNIKTKYVRISYKNDLGMYDMQFELGDKATDYEPYKEQIVPLDLKGNWVGKINDNIKDYLVTDKKKYWLVKNVGKVILDGSESGDWWKQNNQFRHYIENALYEAQTRCSHFKKGYGNNEYWFYATNYIGFTYTDITSVEEWKNWLSNNNVEVYYQLAEPQIIYLGELPEPIKTFEGVNNIQLLANLDTSIEVKYALDLKKYYDNKLAEISAQII